MTERYSLNLSLFILISFFLHTVLIVSFILPDSDGFFRSLLSNPLEKRQGIGGRDIIVNINQDDVRDIRKGTLLSDRDSTAKGFITKEKGDRWLNNSLEFRMKSGSAGGNGRIATSGSGEKIKTSDNGDVSVRYGSGGAGGGAGNNGNASRMAIPDKNSITMKNALFYSNSGLFSFNTAKFKNFTYFKNMKDRIASNWYPPLLANAALGGYAPGNMRIMAIPSQKVKIVFIMNRAGDIVRVELVDSLGNNSLDESCLDAIRLSRSFGEVPDNIKGEFILIPFIFGYYAN
ncbi:MAG TPA: TonB C-terminal domain-containing protein [Spirochaetota bacterium]|nr:TonB C-terminal domain-containing protein [Spirochaetota bacterium]HPJ34675.1 TonB C-terminal domain-containing protein [Spirochaetota bacterium]